VCTYAGIGGETLGNGLFSTILGKKETPPQACRPARRGEESSCACVGFLCGPPPPRCVCLSVFGGGGVRLVDGFDGLFVATCPWSFDYVW
jgi:hypothetical protein